MATESTDVFLVSGVPGVTYKVSSSDVAAGIDSSKLTLNDKIAQAMQITIENNDIRTSSVETPRQDGDGSGELGHIRKENTNFEVLGEKQIENFEYISKLPGESAVLTITIFYFARPKELFCFEYEVQDRNFVYPDRCSA
jgi:hypothetical protein